MDKDEKYCRHCGDFYQMSNQTMVDYHSLMACRPDYFELDSPKTKSTRPYSDEDYKTAKEQGLDLDDWADYEKYFGLGEEEDYS